MQVSKLNVGDLAAVTRLQQSFEQLQATIAFPASDNSHSPDTMDKSSGSEPGLAAGSAEAVTETAGTSPGQAASSEGNPVQSQDPPASQTSDKASLLLTPQDSGTVRLRNHHAPRVFESINGIMQVITRRCNQEKNALQSGGNMHLQSIKAITHPTTQGVFTLFATCNLITQGSVHY